MKELVKGGNKMRALNGKCIVISRPTPNATNLEPKQ